MTNELWGIRKGTYKLHVKTVSKHRGTPVIHDPPLLFNLANDPWETHNIADEHPGKVEALLSIFKTMKRSELADR